MVTHDPELVVYWDDIMLDHQPEAGAFQRESTPLLAYDQPHPDREERMRNIKRIIEQTLGQYTSWQSVSPADEDDLTSVHTKEYIADFKAFCEQGGGRLTEFTAANEASYDAARYAAGAAIHAAQDAIETEGPKVPYALCRPSGHHAQPAQADGYCFFNNIAIAAESLIQSGQAQNVAIIDWDVHHGNGTQDVFFDRGDVFYASIHEQGLYPGTGGSKETGTGAGEATTLNVPLQAGAGDGAYAAVIDDLLAPALARFDPDLLLISAGFDAHQHDPISRMQVSSEGYGVLADRVRDVAATSDAGLGFILEGGYSLEMLAEGVTTVHEVFHGREPMEPEVELDGDVAARIDTISERHDL